VELRARWPGRSAIEQQGFATVHLIFRGMLVVFIAMCGEGLRAQSVVPLPPLDSLAPGSAEPSPSDVRGPSIERLPDVDWTEPRPAGSIEPARIEALPSAADVGTFDRLPPLAPPSDQPPQGDELLVPTPAPVPSAWWHGVVSQPLDAGRMPRLVSLDQLIYLALCRSPRITAISQEPLVREAQVTEAEAEFDPELFVRSHFEDRTDPVGNILTTGGEPFLKDHIWVGEAGVRRKLLTGGELEVGEQLGFENNNSRFFFPQDQGTATLSINYDQPLLRGAGKCYNRSQIVLAQLQSGIAWDRFSVELQDELVAIVDAYWRLFNSRAVLVQKQRSVELGQVVLDRLEARAGLDSLPNQITRARAAVQSRRTELANAHRDVLDAETEIRRLINDGDPVAGARVELIPIDAPHGYFVPRGLANVVAIAMDARPEIRHGLKRARAAAVELSISQNEILPELTMIFRTYASGLEGDTGIEQAWAEQFTNSTPGYLAGLEFSLPVGNRAARSRLVQRRLQQAGIRADVERIVQDVTAEVQIALRRVDSAYATMVASAVSIEAAEADLRQHQERWEAFALVEGDLADGATPTTLLDQLLDAQQRLTDAELVMSQAQMEFQVAQALLNRAMGTLLGDLSVNVGRSSSCGLPQLELSR